MLNDSVHFTEAKSTHSIFLHLWAANDAANLLYFNCCHCSVSINKLYVAVHYPLNTVDKDTPRFCATM